MNKDNRPLSAKIASDHWDDLGYTSKTLTVEDVIQLIRDSRYSCYKDEQCWENLSDERQRGIVEHEEEIIAKLKELK